MSRKLRYTEAKRTYATSSSSRNRRMTSSPTALLGISFSPSAWSRASTVATNSSSWSVETGRFSTAFFKPRSSFSLSNGSRRPSFFTTRGMSSSTRS